MKILILGGNGMIGHKIYQELKNEFDDTWVLFRRKFSLLSYKDFYDSKVIDEFEGGYWNPYCKHKSIGGSSTETMFGLDRYNGNIERTDEGKKFMKNTNPDEETDDEGKILKDLF